MPLQHHPLPAPNINASSSVAPTSDTPGGATPSPETSYFSPRPPITQTRSHNSADFVASPSAIPRTPPGNLLRLSPSSEPQAQSRQDQTYVSTGPNRSHSRHTRTTSPTDNLSNPSYISPGLSSGESFHSSDTGRSPCSYSSSEFLTPPKWQLDTDNPPYKPRRASSDSLTMVRKLRQANTTPYDKEYKRRKRHQKHHKCRQKKIQMYEHSTRSYWWLSGGGCHVAPTASAGQRHLCEVHAEQHPWRITRGGNADTQGSLVSGLKSKRVPAVVTRRWSSVEIGTYQVRLESTLPVMPDTAEFATVSPKIDQFSSNTLGQRYRSSTVSRGAIDRDLVRTIRQRLTLRKIPHEELPTPASITLRRASGESARSLSENGTGGSTPLVFQSRGLNTRRPSVAYLITTEDIDSVTQLIQANLKQEFNSGGRSDLLSPSLNTHSCQEIPSLGITNKGMAPSNDCPAELAVTAAEVQPINARPHRPFDFLQVIPPYKRRKGTISRRYSEKSIHEIIWEGGGSPKSASSVTGEDNGKCSTGWEFPFEPSTPGNTSFHQDIQAPDSFKSDKGDAFDPKNARASISEWSSRCPQEEIVVVVTSSDSDSHQRSPETSDTESPRKSQHGPKNTASKGTLSARVRPSLRSAVSDTTLQDVVSFPPLLPRKTTIDWYSPLPPMEMSPPPLTTSQSLYDMGIDVSFGPSSSKTVNLKSSQTSWVRSAEASHSSSLEFDPNYEIRSKSPEKPLGEKIRQQSVIKALPSTLNRTGEPSAVGSSIGASSGERRKSSGPGMQHKASPRLFDSSAVRSSVGPSSIDRRTPPPLIRRKDSPRPGDVSRIAASHGASLGERKKSPPPQFPHEAIPPQFETIPRTPSNIGRPERQERSSSPRIQRVRTIDNAHKGERDAPVSKWRAPSPCPTPRSPSPSEYEDGRELLPNSPGAGRTLMRTRSGWVDRLSLIRDRSPPLAAVDRIGIYGRMTGSQGASKVDKCQDRRDTPPAKPHDCDDCEKDPRTPSVDWIG